MFLNIVTNIFYLQLYCLSSLFDVLQDLVLDLIGLKLQDYSLDPSDKQNVEEAVDPNVCIPWLFTQFALVNHSALNQVGNVSYESVLVFGTALFVLVFIDKFSLFV